MPLSRSVWSMLCSHLMPLSRSPPYICLVNAVLSFNVALYPGLLTPVFVTCSINAGEGLVKLSHLDVWRSDTFLCTAVKRFSESKKRRQDCLMSSAQLFYGPYLQSVAHSLTCRFCGNVPLLHTSRYVIPRDSVLPGLPPR